MHRHLLTNILHDAQAEAHKVERSKIVHALLADVATAVVAAVERDEPSLRPVIDLIEKIIHMQPGQREAFVHHDAGRLHTDITDGVVKAFSDALAKHEKAQTT